MTLQPCSNEECRGECRVDTAEFSRVWQVFCERNCGYTGPAAANATEAIELHNRMPRTEPWVSVSERMPEHCGQECYVAFSDGTVVGTLCWHGTDWRWSQDYCPHDVEDEKTATHWKLNTPPRGPVSR